MIRRRVARMRRPRADRARRRCSAVALATWSVQDPSLSHATNAPVRNLLGMPGAIVADLLMQLLGLAAIALRAAGRDLGLAARHASAARSRMAAAVVLARRRAACGAASPPACRRSAHWPLPTGLGGVVGDALLRLPALVLGPLDGMRAASVAAAMFGVCTLASRSSSPPASAIASRADDELDERWARRGRRPRGRRRGAHLDLARLARACAAQPQGAHRRGW